MSYTWFVAKRLYSQGGGSHKASRTAIAISTLGVALGLAIMIISLSVVLGFKAEVQRKIVGIGSHQQILNYQTAYSTDAQPIVVDDSLAEAIAALPGVASVQRFCQKTGMLKTEDGFLGVLFQGIGEDYDLGFLRQSLVAGTIDAPFSASAPTERLVVSQRMAQQLRLAPGSRVYAYFFDQKLRARRFTVEAVYATHLSEHDAHLVFCDYATVHRLLDYEPSQSSGAEIVLADMNLLDSVSAAVNSMTSRRTDDFGAYYSSPTIKELYPHIFAWLDLMDVNVLVILVLMLAVAGFTAVSGLLIIILERTQFIGVMKALGSTNRSLRHVFIYYAMLIIGRGMVLGNVLGLGLCLLQQSFGLVRLDATTYYVDTAPILISWPLVLAVNAATFLLALLALLVPSLVVSRIQPARSIRFE